MQSYEDWLTDLRARDQITDDEKRVLEELRQAIRAAIDVDDYMPDSRLANDVNGDAEHRYSHASNG